MRTLVIDDAPDTISRQFFGQIVARETVDLAFEVGGTMRRLMPEEGMRVNAGEMIAQLRLDAFERAVARAELQVEMATREASRAADLAARAAAPTSRAEDAETAREMADVDLRDARAALEDASLLAPFDGLVAARLIPEHASVAPGQPVLRLHDMSEMRVEIAVPERLFAAAGGLEALRFTGQIAGQPDIDLRLVGFQPETASVGQSYRVTLALPAGTGGLLPGASIEVTVMIPASARGVPVPAAALIATADRQAKVMVVEGADVLTVRSVAVQVAAPAGSSFLVEGLPPEAEIVVTGAHLLRDGQQVRRFAPLTFSEN
ncbi:MAG: efflux RND transporter periplasmic adaptor subunit [Loktanella sp.]|nr:efflux RND transporter periplasmic adaptor subunit [Loktanella sp.]